jgi:hypothetical protein
MIIASAGCASKGQISGQTDSVACHDQVLNSGTVIVTILFAKNSAVQRYVFDPKHGTYEDQHQALLVLEKQYGPAQVNAPPLNVISFKKGESGGLMIPDKAVDSCGRTLAFAQ